MKCIAIHFCLLDERGGIAKGSDAQSSGSKTGEIVVDISSDACGLLGLVTGDGMCKKVLGRNVTVEGEDSCNSVGLGQKVELGGEVLSEHHGIDVVGAGGSGFGL